ncbi:C40 family peptidase [Dysgonomonas macrotermitis]|uniref:SH3 domain-containing protein n=1 Tax=Dysgonomonas macrotermitis TaxID=1346286 RepID=A0A1M5H5M5_9BACT|nr:C40 family peptidase [Dysgonomonas macrotermitis]SHG11299.1 SH3 domain-containing protein [Dysgonomonas macrotermitis]
MEHFAIFLNTVLPVRALPSETSEMVTQLLFGQTCDILEISGSFSKIRNTDDGYEGWADTKMLTPINKADFENVLDSPVFRTCIPLADAFCLTDKLVYHISAGSRIPFYDPESNVFEIANKKYQIHSSALTYLTHQSPENILPTAMIFINTPYLWGGKHILGIDCSGFTQVVFSLCGYSISRDAGTQVKEGINIESLDNANAGDLLFFDKKGKTTHVGIYLGKNKIIHASGKVRIDKIDKKGIYNTDSNEYTHSLSSIRRV